LAITSLTSGGRSVGIVRSRTQTKEFYFDVQVKTAIQLNSIHVPERRRITAKHYNI
jgi:hypothetical protein